MWSSLLYYVHRAGYNYLVFFLQNGASQAGNGLLDSGLYIPAVERLYSIIP
jgi:hypothetical protein